MKIGNWKLEIESGFTLVELLVVIAIVGVLAGVVIVAINPATRLAEARDAGRKSDIGQIGTAMEAYFTRKQVYPDVIADVGPASGGGSDDLKRVPADPNAGASGCAYAITPATEDATDHAVYACLEADTSECTGGLNAYFCYTTNTGTGAVLCKATAPDATCL